MTDRGRRFVGLVGLGVHRTVERASRSRQIAFAAVGVALAVMLVVTVGGVALALASGAAGTGDADYRVVPAGSSVESIAVQVGGPKLGGVHATTAELAADPRVEYVTPVGFQVLRVSNPATVVDRASRDTRGEGVVDGGGNGEAGWGRDDRVRGFSDPGRRRWRRRRSA